MIICATIVGSFGAEPVNIETSTPQSVKEAQPQKRAIFNDCDGPLGVVGGLHSDIVSSDLSLGLQGPAYAPAYSGGYSSGYSSGYLASSGIIGSVGSVGAIGSVAVAPPPIISSGYAAHAPVIASSVFSAPVVSHPPIIAAPPVRFRSHKI